MAKRARVDRSPRSRALQPEYERPAILGNINVERGQAGPAGFVAAGPLYGDFGEVAARQSGDGTHGRRGVRYRWQGIDQRVNAGGIVVEQMEVVLFHRPPAAADERAVSEPDIGAQAQWNVVRTRHAHELVIAVGRIGHAQVTPA